MKIGRLSFLTAILALGFSIQAWAGIAFLRCDTQKQQAVVIANNRAQQMTKSLKARVSLELLLNRTIYDKKTVKKLEGALEKLSCLQRKLEGLIYVCTNKDHPSYVARTWPIGIRVKLDDDYFTSSAKYQASTLIHEGSHKCFTNDAEYYHQHDVNPDKNAHKNWQNTASIYDWWLMRGFCVPGYNCSLTGADYR